jgi:hypothetical protein
MQKLNKAVVRQALPGGGNQRPQQHLEALATAPRPVSGSGGDTTRGFTARGFGCDHDHPEELVLSTGKPFISRVLEEEEEAAAIRRHHEF